MSSGDIPEDIRAVYEEFPGWVFGTVWITAASGPDARRIWAMRGGFLLSGWTAEDVAYEIYRIPGQPPAPGTGREEPGQ